MQTLKQMLGTSTHKICLFSKNSLPPIKDAFGVLREPQAEIIPEAMTHLINGKNVIVEMGPGGGKTLIGQIISQKLASLKIFGKLTIISVPKLAINYEPKDNHAIYDKIYKLNKDQFEKIDADSSEKKISKIVSIIKSYSGDTELTYYCTHAALARAFGYMRSNGMSSLLKKVFVILDEGHHSGISDEDEKADNLLGGLIRMLEKVGGQYMLTTATNFRSDGKPLIKNSKNCHLIIRSYYDLLHGYGAPYLANQSIAVCFYSYEESKRLNKVIRKSTDKKPITGNLEALIEAYLDQYERNPVPTLINCPYASLKNGTKAIKNKDIAIMVEDAFRRRFPKIRLLNVGAIRKGGKVFLVSETSDRHKIYDETRNNPNAYDVVIQIRVMEEGVDWVACRRTFCHGITVNNRLFIQRDVGRGARVKPLDNEHEIVYFIHGVIPQKNSKQYTRALKNLYKQMAHYESLIVANGIYSDIVSSIKLFNGGDTARTKRIPIKVIRKVIGIIQDRGIYGEMDSKRVWNIINNCKLLESYSVKEKLNLFANLEKISKETMTKIIEKTSDKVELMKISMSKAFHQWYKIFEEELGNMNIEEIFVKSGREFRTKMTSKKMMKDVEALFFVESERILTEERVDELVESVMND